MVQDTKIVTVQKEFGFWAYIDRKIDNLEA